MASPKKSPFSDPRQSPLRPVVKPPPTVMRVVDLEEGETRNVPKGSVLSVNREEQLLQAVQAVARAKRVAVVCGERECRARLVEFHQTLSCICSGAGISCASGIPDFRSSDGLFKTLKDKNPKAGLSSGKDLFSANLFKVRASRRDTGSCS